MNLKFTFLKRSLALTLICLALNVSVWAQHEVASGGMPANAGDDWTWGWRNGSSEQSSVEFGISDASLVPDGATSTTAVQLKFSSPAWNETQLWQVVTLTKGVEYFLNAKLKIEIPAANTWIQGFLKPWEEPSLANQKSYDDPQLANATQLLALHVFTDKSEDIITHDGDFPKNVAGNQYLTGTSLTPDATGDYIVLFKFGGGVETQQSGTLTDVTVTAGEATLVNLLDKNVIKAYPTVCDEFITVTGIRSNAGAEIYSMTGKLISSRTIANNENLDVSSLNPGMYILQITDGQDKSTLKFFKR
ncbi:MAG: T9SS type A sorting domain-containing protein [Bacteroidales bacterium]|nr:T9SS type A sorting domain-containing protein [Bacteroidales bacterium]